MKWKIHEDHKGFTLIELLVSVAILAFVIAPFLSSFATAGQSNVDSKRKQEVTDLSQAITEEFRVADLNLLKANFNCVESTNSSDEKIYTFNNIPCDKYDSAVGGRYSAKVVLNPVKTQGEIKINSQVTPSIEETNGSNMAVFKNIFYMYDAKAGGRAAERIVTIIVTKQEVEDSYEKKEKYVVTPRVDYVNEETGEVMDSLATSFEPLVYDTVPVIYMIYPPKSIYDTIYIQNELKEEDLNGKTLKVYLSEQKQGFGAEGLKTGNIYINDEATANQDYQYTAIVNDASCKEKGGTGYGTKYTTIYSNVEGSGNPLNVVKKETLYDMEVTVYQGTGADRKEVGKITTTKTLNKEGN